jgi:hypothetical protein
VNPNFLVKISFKKLILEKFCENALRYLENFLVMALKVEFFGGTEFVKFSSSSNSDNNILKGNLGCHELFPNETIPNVKIPNRTINSRKNPECNNPEFFRNLA